MSKIVEDVDKIDLSGLDKIESLEFDEQLCVYKQVLQSLELKLESTENE